MISGQRSIWVFGDYRNYFQNRVTLQLLARANELAERIGADVCAVVFGSNTAEYVGEYIAHGAHQVYVIEDSRLDRYHVETFVHLLERLARIHQPEMLLVGATDFGREFAPRLAKRLGTGLTADCIGLDIDEEGRLVQSAPSFGGNLVARIVTPEQRPQMATVRPGVFSERPHDYDCTGRVFNERYPEDLPQPRIRVKGYERITESEKSLEESAVVVCGGRGMGSKKKFKKLYELAKMMNGEVGATRPVVYADWAGHDALVGQAGRQIKPKLLLSFGISGAIQHTAAITHADFIVAVNKNPEATMMKMADVAMVADAGQLCTALMKELKKRLRS
ncbi:MAG: electron transfer flavoprotein subunit alpha/FixB family protein [Desulfobacterales bacterium]|jgi:electron transfer flavoprotein alpha subunit|nr:electron transfer flavoprotein subunit alpha/FixB family protein [Desulfobacterales bacterium]